jgi:hypothetical protein
MYEEKDLLFDVRVRAHQLRDGHLTKKDIQAALDKLEDCAAMAEPTTTAFVNPFEARHFSDGKK